MNSSTFRSCRYIGEVLLGLAASTSIGSAQIIDPAYSGSYGSSATLVGTVPTPLLTVTTAIAFSSGSPNTLLVGGSTGGRPDGAIYSIGVTRDVANHITGFTGSPTLVSTAFGPSGGAIDGGLAYGPLGNLFYTTFPDSGIGQITTGSSSPSTTATLPIGSPGSLAFTPAGFGSDGHLKLTSYIDNAWYDATLTPNGPTFNVSVGSSVALGANFKPEGIAYVAAGQPDFSNNSVLIASVGDGKVYAYQTDASGNPNTGTKQTFMTLGDLGGLVLDPLTGDLLGVTTQLKNLYEVRGFTAVPEPGAWSLMAGLACLAGAVWRRSMNRSAAL